MQSTNTKGIQDYTWLGWKGDPLGIVQETQFLPYYQMVNALTRIHLRK